MGIARAYARSTLHNRPSHGFSLGFAISVASLSFKPLAGLLRLLQQVGSWYRDKPTQNLVEVH